MRTNIYLYQYFVEFFLERKFPKEFVEKRQQNFKFKNFFPEIRFVYEIMWKNVVQPDTEHMII